MNRLVLAAAIFALIGCDTSTPTEPDAVHPLDDRDYYEEHEDPDPVDTGGRDTTPAPQYAAACVSYPESEVWIARPANFPRSAQGRVAWDVLVDNDCDAAVLVYIKASAWLNGRLVGRRTWRYEPNHWERLGSGYTRWYCRDLQSIGRAPSNDALENGCDFRDSSGSGLWETSYSGRLQVTFSAEACWLEGPCEEPPNPAAP